MVIRRIREHAAALNWFAVGIDLAIVVVGVFLGTQANNWNQARADRVKAAGYRTRLVGELRFDQRQYHQQFLYYTAARRHGLAALHALQQPGATLGEPFLIDAYQATQMDLTPPKHFIFDELVSAGLAGLIGDETLQEMTSDYYLSLATDVPQLAEAPPYRELLRREMPYAVQAPIRERCGDRDVLRNNQVIGQSFAKRCVLGLDPALVAASVSHLRAVAGLDTALTRYLSALDQKITLLGANSAKTDRLVKTIEAVRN